MFLPSENVIFDTFFPRRCFACDHNTFEPLLCDLCSSLIEPLQNPLFLANGNQASLFNYNFTIKKLIHEAKFNNSLPHAQALMLVANQAFKSSNLSQRILTFDPDIVTFVPSSLKDRFNRGFELSLLFASFLAKNLQKPLKPLLKKPFNAPKISHIRQKRFRQEMVKECFFLTQTINGYKKILLVDDVVTTCATLSQCSKLLKNKDGELACLTIAKTRL